MLVLQTRTRAYHTYAVCVVEVAGQQGCRGLTTYVDTETEALARARQLRGPHGTVLLYSLESHEWQRFPASPPP